MHCNFEKGCPNQHFQNTLLVGRERVTQKSTLGTLLMMLTILDDPSQNSPRMLNRHDVWSRYLRLLRSFLTSCFIVGNMYDYRIYSGNVAQDYLCGARFIANKLQPVMAKKNSVSFFDSSFLILPRRERL